MGIIGDWETLIGQGTTLAFGNQFLVGAFVFLFFIGLFVFLGLGLSAAAVVLFPLMWVLTYFGLLPQVFFFISLILAGAVVGLAVLRVLRG
jgi:hypothetical protein